MTGQPGQSGRYSIAGGRNGKTPMRSIRVPDEDWTAWQTAAKRAGLSVSEWIRQQLNAAIS
jgi:predicted HicB family RNase H-like nuclease